MGQIDSFEFRRTKFNSPTFRWWAFIRFTPCKHKKRASTMPGIPFAHNIVCFFFRFINKEHTCMCWEWVYVDRHEKKHTHAHNLLAEMPKCANKTWVGRSETKAKENYWKMTEAFQVYFVPEWRKSKLVCDSDATIFQNDSNRKSVREKSSEKKNGKSKYLVSLLKEVLCCCRSAYESIFCRSLWLLSSHHLVREKK